MDISSTASINYAKILIKDLIPGDLYRAINGAVPIYNDKGKNLLVQVEYDHVALLVDDCYYCIKVQAVETEDGLENMIYFCPYSDPEQVKKSFDDLRDVYIKIAFNGVIGYANFLSLVRVENKL